VDHRRFIVSRETESHTRTRAKGHVPRVVRLGLPVVDSHLERLVRRACWAGSRNMHIRPIPLRHCPLSLTSEYRGCRERGREKSESSKDDGGAHGGRAWKSRSCCPSLDYTASLCNLGHFTRMIDPRYVASANHMLGVFRFSRSARWMLTTKEAGGGATTMGHLRALPCNAPSRVYSSYPAKIPSE
jgi:hypothetical protein